MTSTTTAIQRIVKARRAMMAAQNPQFKDYWKRTVDHLQKQVSN